MQDSILVMDLRVNGNVEQNGTTFTLDADNAGAGATVEIVANQGSDADGVLRYNTTLNEWEFTDNGGTNYNSLVYGTEFNLFEDNGVSTNTTTTYQDKINQTTSSLPVGTYKLTVSYNWNLDTANSDFLARIFFDGTNLDAANNNEMHRQEAKDSAGAFGATGTDQKYGFTKNYFIDVTTAGTKNVQLEWAS